VSTLEDQHTNIGVHDEQPHNNKRCLAFSGREAARIVEDPSQISEILKDENTFVWLDLAEPTAEDLQLVQEEFAIHPVAIEDAHLTHERPKIEIFSNFVLLVVHGAAMIHGRIVISEMAIFANKNYLVTIRQTPLFSIKEIEKRWSVHAGPIPHTAIGLLYVILDTIVDSYFPIADAYDGRIDRIEAHLFDPKRKAQTVLKEIFNFKRDLQVFRRAAAPVREILAPIIRGDVEPLDAGIIAYYRDIYDHVLRMVDQIDAQRDLINSALDVHLSLQSHRQGEIAKQLTIIATIFLPLTFITGFFGQNFDFLVKTIAPEPIFWWFGVGSEIFALIALLVYFRYKRWF
jgi:magnesium transporter